MTISTIIDFYQPREVFAQNPMSRFLQKQEDWANSEIADFAGDWQRYVLNLPNLSFNEIPPFALSANTRQAKLFRLGIAIWAKRVGHPRSYASQLIPPTSSNQLQFAKSDGTAYLGNFTQNFTQTPSPSNPDPKIKGSPQFRNGKSVIALSAIELLQILKIASRSMFMVPSVIEINDMLLKAFYSDQVPQNQIPYLVDPQSSPSWNGVIQYRFYNLSSSMILYFRLYSDLLPAPAGINAEVVFS